MYIYIYIYAYAHVYMYNQCKRKSLREFWEVLLVACLRTKASTKTDSTRPGCLEHQDYIIIRSNIRSIISIIIIIMSSSITISRSRIFMHIINYINVSITIISTIHC